MSRRNPNGYGCVTKLSGNRSRPYVVKVTVYDAEGHARQAPVGYAATREDALILLAQYNNNPWNIDREKVTLAVLYQRWLKIKAPKLSPASLYSLKAAYKHCSKYYGVKYRSLRAYQMQDCIDSCRLSYSTQAAIKNLFGHLDRFAFEMDIIDKMYSQLTMSPPIPDTKREPFTPEQIEALWKISDQEWVDTVLIYIYTGFRLNELLGMRVDQVNVAERYLQGGIKTSSGKDRIVPIHPRIWPFIEKRIQGNDTYLFSYHNKKLSPKQYYVFWNETMGKIGADKSPHEARHTFETLLDNAGGKRKCIDLLMGHKSKDVGNRVYNHKTLEQLRETIGLLR